jgi:hypothetical protein
VNIKGLAMLIVNLYKKILLLLVSCTIFLSSCWSSDESGSYDSVSAGPPTLALEDLDLEELKVTPQLEATERGVVKSQLASETTELFPHLTNDVNKREEVSPAAKSVDENLTLEAVGRDCAERFGRRKIMRARVWTEEEAEPEVRLRNTCVEEREIDLDLDLLALPDQIETDITTDEGPVLGPGSSVVTHLIPLDALIPYEAQECSNNIFYTGVTPDQQLEPAIVFMYKHSPAAGGNVFLIGSDDVFPRILNTITKAQVKQLGGTVVGEDYLPLGNTEVAPIISKIKKALPEGGIIINTLYGDQNVAFFKQIQEAGITPSSGYYAMNYSIAQEEISTIGPKYLEGHYGVWNYTTSIDIPENDGFRGSRVQPIAEVEISTIGPEYLEGPYGVLDYTTPIDTSEKDGLLVEIEEEPTRRVQGFSDDAISKTQRKTQRKTQFEEKLEAPQDPVEVMPNHHLSQTVIIGEINREGGITILKATEVILPHALGPEILSSAGFSRAQTDDWQLTEGLPGYARRLGDARRLSDLLVTKIVPDGEEFLRQNRMGRSAAVRTPSNQLGVGLSYKEACDYNGRVEFNSSPLATATDTIPMEEKVRICSTVNQLEIYCVLEGEKKRKLKDYTEELKKTIAELGVKLETRNKVIVSFEFDKDGMLEVTSQDKSLGEKINVKANCK